MDKESTPPADDFTIRCPRLGHQITFSYCRSETLGLPCSKILDCWFEHFQVEDWLRKDMSTEDWEKTFQRDPKPKITSLLELIEQAKKRGEEKDR
ncbi:MAG: hypothetical protein V2J25_15605 [Desulfatiglans sp.]|jgi:hypothetical protein|nr:hypothetical protein [Thermodesulfobacteriota bacterium]MEE4354286.1 hypothetical protein [Desulfatiglans sp.]